MNAKHIIIITTFSKQETGDKIITKLLAEKLAACIQAFPIKSSYSWKGEICHDAETALLIKTKEELYAEVEAAIKSVHDYDIPEIIAVPIQTGSSSYFGWIADVTK